MFKFDSFIPQLMAYREFPQISPLNLDGFDYYWQPQHAPPDTEQEDHHCVVVYNLFNDQTVMYANAATSCWQPPIEGPFPGPEHFYYPAEELVSNPDQLHQTPQYFQQPHLHASSELLASSNQPVLVNLSQAVAYPLAPDSEPHEQYPFHDQPLSYAAQPFQPLQQQQQGRSEYPPVYFTTDNVPATQTPTSSLLLALPGYNYVANHPSSANSRQKSFLCPLSLLTLP